MYSPVVEIKKKKMNKKTFTLLFTITAFILLLSHIQIKNNKLKTPAPDYRAKTLNHDTFFLNEHKGKVILLFFWTTWCSICKGEILFLNEIYLKYSMNDLVIVGVNCDRGNISEIKKISQKYKIAYTILLDNGEIMKLYKVSMMPTTILIDKKQKIRFLHGGYTRAIARQMEGEIETLIKEEYERQK